MIDRISLAIRMCPIPTATSGTTRRPMPRLAQYTFGNAGRNSLLGPGYGEVDLSLTKSFAITERDSPRP